MADELNVQVALVSWVRYRSVGSLVAALADTENTDTNSTRARSSAGILFLIGTPPGKYY
jgi:hypothetical protein